MSRPGLVLSCEHAGNRVPDEFADVFRGSRDVLASHRGWDAGAVEVARALGERTGVTPHLHFDTRLLIDANRSLGHPRSFSELTRGLPPEARARIVDRYYRPHRRRVEEAIQRSIRERGRCLHVSVHSFTPRLDGVERQAEIGLLYDPKRRFERDVASAWKATIREAMPRSRVRRNYPYRGVSDGLTTELRRRYPDERYAGIELEVNQALLADRDAFAEAARSLAESLGRLLA